MADSNILQDDFVLDADEEDALLENRHSTFFDRDGEKVDRYNFDDDEEEDILDIGLSEELTDAEQQLTDYIATVDKSSQRKVEKKDSKIISFSKPATQSNVVNTVSSSGGVSEASVAENVPSSTSGVGEVAAETEKDDSRFKGAKKIVISNSKNAGPVVRPNFQLFTKELRNRRDQNTNIKKRLGGQLRQGNMQMRQGNMRMRHPNPRFMSPNQGGERMMGPPQFRPPGPHFRPGGPPRQLGPPPPRPGGPPPHQQRGQGPWPRKILINPHFNQNNQNKNQQWGGQNQPPQRFHPPAPQPQEWQTPPPQQFTPQFQPEPQPPRFRPAPPPTEYDQRREQYDQYPPRDLPLQPSPVMTPEPQPTPYYQQQNYRQDYGSYQEPPNQSLPPPSHQHAPPQAPAYQQQQGYYQQYPETRPPPQQPRMEPAAPSYDMQPQSHVNQYEAPRLPPPMMGSPDVEMIHPEQPYSQHPSSHQNYPPPQAQYATEAPNQYAPQPYEVQNQFQPPRHPPPNQFQQPPPNPAYRPDFNRPQAPRPAPDRNQYPPDPNQYAYGQGPPRSDPYDRPPVNQLAGPSSADFAPEPRQPLNQFNQPVNQGFSQPDIAPAAPYPGRGNIKSRLGARVAPSPLQGQPRQSPQQGIGAQFGQKVTKRTLNPVHSGASPPKHPRYDQSTARKVPSRNLQEVPTVSNLPDTTTFNEREAEFKEDEDEEMREYRKKIEAQKQFREKIFEIKEARRKQAVLQQGRAGTTQTNNPTSSASAAPGPSRSVQPIATIVSSGAGKRPVPGNVRKTGGAPSNNAMAKRAARFGGQQPSLARSEIVDVNKPLRHFNVGMVDGKIMIQSKTEGQRSVILPDTTQGQQSTQTGSSEPNLASKTGGTQPRTLDERFSSLKSGVLVQPKEERFTSSSNRTVLPASGRPQLDPNASSIVIVDNLSASTKAQQLVDIASQCGKLAELNLKQSQKQAILKFKTPVGAAEFFKKYQRKMIDLSMISLTMGPPAKS